MSFTSEAGWPKTKIAGREMKIQAESSCILHAKEFLLYFTRPLIIILLRVYVSILNLADLLDFAFCGLIHLKICPRLGAIGHLFYFVVNFETK